MDIPSTLTADLTVPNTVLLQFQKNAVIALGAFDLTLNCPFEAGNWQIFNQAGVGAVTLSKIARPEWWGIDGTADQTEIVAAANALSSGVIELEAGKTYDISAQILIQKSISIWHC